jgi:hypothetical protein
MLVGSMSQKYDDRQMLLALEGLTMLSLFFMVDMHVQPYPALRYQIAAVVSFVSLQALEGV